MNKCKLYIFFLVIFFIFTASHSHAASIEDIKKSFRYQKSDNREGANVLKEITLKPYLGKSAFWKQTPEEFKKTNPFGDWKEYDLGSEKISLTLEKPSNITLWGLRPIIISVRFTNNQLDWIEINLWNKGDSKSSLHLTVMNRLNEIKSRLENAGFFKEEEREKVSSFYKRKWEVFKLGPTVLSFSHKEYEYFFIKLESASKKAKESKKETDFLSQRKDPKKEFLKEIKKHVKKETSGDVFIEGIPMIDQGKKGYCAPATCARVLIYYGLDVDMHLVADMMKTSEQGSGTTGRDLEYSLRRLCRDNPFALKRIKNFRIRLVKKFIDQGLPIIWLIPGHLRLIIGYNDNEKNIIYSDTWGDWAAKRKMDYKEAENITSFMFILK